MTAHDGHVGATATIVDHGPSGRRWDLVVLGDGYRGQELPRFHADAGRVVEVLRSTPPFDELWPAVNVHTVEVVSHQSGADDPYECADDEYGFHGAGTTARTYFDSTFCDPRWGIRRLLTADSDRVRRLARQRVPLSNVALLLVNTDVRGGAGDPGVAVCSRAFVDTVAVHELGHSAFGLADEYGDEPASGGDEPKEPNVTRATELAELKWRAQVEPTTPIPTWRDPSCSQGFDPAGPAGDLVGSYEGARYERCETYRPFPDCYMRSSFAFCPVCRQVIRDTLAPFLG